MAISSTLPVDSSELILPEQDDFDLLMFGPLPVRVMVGIAFIVTGFIAGLTYLQYHQIANINWNKLQTVSEDTITTLSNAIITHIPGISSSSGDIHAAATASSLAMTSFGIPLTGSMSAGITIGFMKG
jgi:uncharacterized membrane protein (Fun14 family)